MDNNRAKSLVRRVTQWIIIIGATIFTAVWLGFLIFRDYGDIIRQHFAATVGLPLAAIASLVIVFVLEYSTGPIEFEGLGFKFKGASGPIILWVFCFLAIAVAIRLLW